MNLDNSEAELHRRAEWLLDQDIQPAVQQTRERLQIHNESLQALQSLDTQWHGSPLPTLVEKGATILGSRYTYTRIIDPSYERLPNGGGVGLVDMPLRLGARVREVAYASNTSRSVQAMRGNILFHRTMLPNGRWYSEAAFYALLVSMQHTPMPQLVFGRLDQPNASEQRLQQDQLVGLEVLLGGVKNVYNKTFRAKTASDVPRPFSVEQALANRIKLAKGTYNEDEDSPQYYAHDSNWQTNFKQRSGITPNESEGAAIDDLFASGRLKRRFKRDLPIPGILAQNQQPFVEGHSATLAMQPALQHFLQEVCQPLQTKPQLQKTLQAELDHATQLELVNALEITDLDVARAVIRRAVAVASTPVFAMPSEDTLKELVRHYRKPTYEDYAETRALLNKYLPKNGRPIAKITDDYASFGRTYNRDEVATGKGLHVLRGILLDRPRADTLEGIFEQEFEKTTIKPSPAAFPLD